MIKKVVLPIILILLLIGVLTATFINENNNSISNLTDSVMGDVANTNTDDILNTVSDEYTSLNTEIQSSTSKTYCVIYDTAISNTDDDAFVSTEGHKLNKKNIITNTLSNSSKQNYINSNDLNKSINSRDYDKNISIIGNNSYTTNITPNQALTIVESIYPDHNFSTVKLNNNGQYVVSNGLVEILINAVTGKREGGTSADGRPLVGDNYTFSKDVNGTYDVTEDDDTNLLDSGINDKYINFNANDETNVSSYTTKITPNEALAIALREYLDLSFNSALLDNFGCYHITDGETTIMVDAYTGELAGGYSKVEIPADRIFNENLSGSVTKNSSLNQSKYVNGTYNVTEGDLGTNLLDSDIKNKHINVDTGDESDVSSYTTYITPAEALAIASREYPELNFNSAFLGKLGEYYITDGETTITVDAYTGELTGSYFPEYA